MAAGMAADRGPIESFFLFYAAGDSDPAVEEWVRARGGPLAVAETDTCGPGARK